MSNTSTKRYVIQLHKNDDGSVGGYGVHARDGQIISGHPTLAQAEAAMARYVEGDKRRQAQRLAPAEGRAKSGFVS